MPSIHSWLVEKRSITLTVVGANSIALHQSWCRGNTVSGGKRLEQDALSSSLYSVYREDTFAWTVRWVLNVKKNQTQKLQTFSRRMDGLPVGQQIRPII